MLVPDLTQTNAMLAMLAPDGKGLTFQTFDDDNTRKGKQFAKVLNGSFEQHDSQLTTLNQQGAGVFVTVQKTDGTGRKAANITAIRAFTADFDNIRHERVEQLQNLKVIHGILSPNMIIESSQGKHHAYWIFDGIEQTVKVSEFADIQIRLHSFLQSIFIDDDIDTSLKDTAKVLRLAGFYHQKVRAAKEATDTKPAQQKQDGSPFLTTILYKGERYAKEQLGRFIEGLPALPIVEPAKQSKQRKHSNDILPKTLGNDHLPQLEAETVRALARGNWHTIFNNLGYSVSNDPTEHTPCPICGGSDRFRFDNEYGSGSYICSQGTGDTIGSDGLSLLIDHAGMSVNGAVTAVTDALNDIGLLSPKDVKTELKLGDWPTPEPLASDPSKPTAYPIDAWRGQLKSVIEKIVYYTQVAPATAGQVVLGALAHMGQRFIDAPMGYKHMPASLILITEGESGTGKTEAMKLSYSKIQEYEREQYKDYSLRLSQWELMREQLNGEDLAHFLKLEPKPVNPSTMFKAPTLEPVLDKFVNGDIFNASWTTDDAAQFFNGYTMSSKTAASALGDITDLYSNGVVERERSQKNAYGNPRNKAYDVRFTLMLMAQRVILEPALSNPLMNGQGFLARAMIACPEDLRGQRVWDDPKRRTHDPERDPDIIAYWQRCESLLDPSAINDPVQNGKGRIKMRWHDTQTEQAFYDGMQVIEDRMKKGKQYEFTRAYASRMAENASRIAALMAFFEGRYTITTDDIKRAFLLVEYSTAERMRYLDASPSGEQNDSEKFSQWLVSKAAKKNPHKLNRSMAYNGAPVPMRKDSRKLDQELSILESAGHIRIETEGKATVIHINPNLYP